MLALVIVPLPPVTTQVCQGLVGCVFTVMAKGCPLAIGAAKANEPEPEMARSPAPFSWMTRPLPVSPVTVPPTMYELVAQFTVTLETSAAPTVPVVPPRLQVCVGLLGCVLMVTV